MASERTYELYKLLLGRGYPKEFCAEIAYKNMNTDYTATRMLGYLYRVSDPRMEDLVEHREASDRVQMLNGMWKFRYFESIYDVRDAFYESGYDIVGF